VLWSFGGEKIIDRPELGEPITANEYIEACVNGETSRESFRNKYVVCTAQEARSLLEFRPLKASLVVPAVLWDLAPMERLNLDDYLVYLSTKDIIDAHTYDKEPDDEGNYVQPDRLPSMTAIGKFRDRDYGLVNFLLYRSSRLA
jgi:hypothetical protein